MTISSNENAVFNAFYFKLKAHSPSFNSLGNKTFKLDKDIETILHNIIRSLTSHCLNILNKASQYKF